MIGWFIRNALWLLLVVGTIFNMLWLSNFQDRLRMKWYAVIILSILHTVYGVLTVKAFAILEAGFDMTKAGNMSLFGGVFLMPLGYFVGAKLFKRRLSDVFDIFVVCMLFTLMCARVNCLISGCCNGCPIPGTESALWPTRELEIAFYVIMLLILGRRARLGTNCGELYPGYMFCYGIFRFVTEFFRESDHRIWGFFHISHIWAAASIIIGGVLYCLIMKRHGKSANPKNIRHTVNERKTK